MANNTIPSLQLLERLDARMNSLLLTHRRGQPLYIFWVYLLGQFMIAPPVFAGAVFFISYITQVRLREFILPAVVCVGGLIALAYVFYYRGSVTIRRFLAAQINREFPDRELALAAWREAVTFPQFVVVRVIITAVIAYSALIALMIPRFGFSLSLIGGIGAIIATVALSQVIYLFYLEWAMFPLTRMTLLAGARPDLDDLRGPNRINLRTKLMLVLVLIIILPVTVMGLFGYRNMVALGGNSTAALLLTGLVALISILIAVGLALLMIRSLSAPLQEMRRVMEDIGSGKRDAQVLPLTTDELAELGLHFNRMVEELRRNEKLTTAFGRYVSPAVRDGILRGTIALGGERREVTILFTDIRNFTTWCEREPPETVIQTLNSYYENLIQALLKHGGTVTRYTGDGVLALFGAPLDDPDHALHAVQAVWEAHTLLEKFNDIRRSVDAFELRTGFGIHTGDVVVGSIGSEARAEYTPIGDAANVASRIEGLNRELGTSILISDDTYQRVADYVEVGRRAEVTVKGRTQPVRVVEVVGLK